MVSPSTGEMSIGQRGSYMLQDEVKKAIEVMRAGGVILYPTDTVWGIGCDATNEEAVRKVFAIKKREDS